MKKLIINKKQGVYALSLDEIVYMEKELRKIRVYLNDGTIEFYGRFPDIMPYLDRRFMCCHRSYVINMDKIVIMSCNTIFMENNERIYMGRDTYGRARKIFVEYLAKKSGQILRKTL